MTDPEREAAAKAFEEWHRDNCLDDCPYPEDEYDAWLAALEWKEKQDAG